jgi:hypothetical protein
MTLSLGGQGGKKRKAEVGGQKRKAEVEGQKKVRLRLGAITKVCGWELNWRLNYHSPHSRRTVPANLN